MRQHLGARLERRERVRVAGVARVVPVEAGALAEAADALDEAAHLCGAGDADRVGQDDLVRLEPLGERDDLAGVHLALERAAERDADRDRRRLLRRREDRLHLRQRLVARHLAVPAVEALGGAERDVDAVEPRRGEALVTLCVQDEARVLGPVAALDRGRRPPRRRPSAARARRARSWPPRRAGSPAAASRLTSSARVAGSSVSASFWRPSRGPTSQSVSGNYSSKPYEST